MNPNSKVAETEAAVPDGDLKDKVVISGSGSGIDMEAVERAEKALEQLSVEFDGWMEEEIVRLVTVRDQIKREGLNGENFDDFFRAAHDLKGEGETFGYPLVSDLCNQLCRLLELTDDKSLIPMTLIDNHVDAVQIVLRDKIKDKDHQTTCAVIDRLSEVVGDLAEHFERKMAS